MAEKTHSQETINTIQHCAEAAPPTASLLLIRAACLEAALLSVISVTIPSPDHLFTSKGSGYIFRHHLPGGRRVGEGTAVTFSVFKTEREPAVST